jgi:hypothetical protein
VVSENSVNDAVFDFFGGNSAPEDDNDDSVIPEWMLEGRRFAMRDNCCDLCMINFGSDFKFPWAQQEDT